MFLTPASSQHSFPLESNLDTPPLGYAGAPAASHWPQAAASLSGQGAGTPPPPATTILDELDDDLPRGRHTKSAARKFMAGSESVRRVVVTPGRMPIFWHGALDDEGNADPNWEAAWWEIRTQFWRQLGATVRMRRERIDHDKVVPAYDPTPSYSA